MMLSNQDDGPEQGFQLPTRWPRVAPPSLRPTACSRSLNRHSVGSETGLGSTGTGLTKKEEQLRKPWKPQGWGAMCGGSSQTRRGCWPHCLCHCARATARHPLQVFAGVRAMREAQAEAAGRCPLGPGHSTPPERLALRPGEPCGLCTAHGQNSAHALRPPKFLSASSTLFPKEQARRQYLFWPKGRPANIAQDRLTVVICRREGHLSVTPALSQQEVGLQGWLREVQGDADSRCPSLHPLPVPVGL